MNHFLARELVGICDLCRTGLAAVECVAFSEETRSSCTMDRLSLNRQHLSMLYKGLESTDTIDTASTKQTLVRSINDRINLQFRDVILYQRNLRIMLGVDCMRW